MEKQIKIALAGNPNCGKTTLFNALTGSNQFVGNWPGVTVEKKEGRLKKHDDVVIMDLPGIYSLSPYTLEEVVARNYLIDERPDAILNIVDGTNLERNLYLTTQLTELGIPVVMAVNMMDIVRKSGDQINISQLSQQLGCKVVEISALKGDGVMAAAEAAIEAAKSTKTVPMHTFSGPVEHAIAHIEEAAVHKMPEEQQRWYAIKIFERDDKVLAKLHIPEDVHQHIEADIKAAEEELDDDAESIITNERYVYIAQVIKSCYKKKSAGKLSASDKIDKIVTNRWLGLPIFAAVMFIVYWVAMVGVGAPATDWANDGLFGDGWHLLGIGSSAYNDAADEYTAASEAVSGYYELDTEAEDFDADAALAEMKAVTADSASTTIGVEDEETLAMNTMTAYYDPLPEGATVKGGYFTAEHTGFVAIDASKDPVYLPVAVAADGTAEKEINLAIARDLYAFAVISGIPASMTRTGDYLVYKAGDDKKRSDLYNRFDYINSVDNAVLVSIHQNHFADTSQWGMQIWYTVNDPLRKALAANILAYDNQHLQPGNRRENKPSDDSYYLLYKAKVPSVMVECGFMSNVKENNQLKQDVYRRRVAFCILAGLSDTMKTGELP